MTVTEDSVYTYVQDLFKKGTVVIVGSGASCAYGLPNMSALAEHLLDVIPGTAGTRDDESIAAWVSISASLRAGVGLEAALGFDEVPALLADAITSAVADKVRTAEASAIATIMTEPAVPALARVLSHILKVTNRVDVITTNYDRLIEVQAARGGLRLDSGYFGHTLGRLNPTLSRGELQFPKVVTGHRARVEIQHHPHIRLAKPHGSLDWFDLNDSHFRTDLQVPGTQRIIAPGGSKYRIGYELPFETQRNRANSAIDEGSALLFVGYGFNDEHLQTHLRSRFPQVPAVVLAHVLTPAAREFLATNSSAVGIEAGVDSHRSMVSRGGTSLEFDKPLWNLNDLAKEVLSI